MEYTKPMIDLVFQIRKTVPGEIKSQIKLTNPDLLGLLLSAYPTFDDQSLRTAIAKLVKMAGASWPYEDIAQPDMPEQLRATDRSGSMTVESGTSGSAGRSRKKALIYRGHTVNEV